MSNEKREPVRLLYPLHYRLTSCLFDTEAEQARIIWFWRGDRARLFSLDAGIALVGTTILVLAGIELAAGWTHRTPSSNLSLIVGWCILMLGVSVAVHITIRRLREAISICCLVSTPGNLSELTFRPKDDPRTRELLNPEIAIKPIRLATSERSHRGLATASWAVILEPAGIVLATEASQADASRTAHNILPDLPINISSDEILCRGDRQMDQRVREIDQNRLVSVWWALRLLNKHGMMPQSLTAKVRSTIERAPTRKLRVPQSRS